MPDFPQVASPTNLYPQPPSQGVLGNPANILDLAGRMQSLQKQRMDIQAQQAIGDAVQRNTDPATGAIDQAGFARDIMANPAARWKALDAMSTMYQQQELQQRMGAAQMNRIHQEIGNLPDNPTDEQINRAFLNLHSIPGMNPAMLQAAKNQFQPMPRPGDKNYDEIIRNRNDIIAGHRKSLMTVQEAETPREVIVDPYGNRVLVPGREYGRPGAAGAAGGAPGAPAYTGGPGLALSPERQSLLTESGKLGTQLLNSRDKLAQEHQLLTELGVLGENLDKKFTGPLSEQEKHLMELAQRFGITGLDDPNLDRAQLYNKILNQIIGSQRGQGADSVADLGVIQASNPSLAMTPHAKKGAVNQLLAMNEFREAMRQEFELAGGNRIPQMYTDWRNATHNREVLDPSIFAYNRLAPEERRAYWDRLSPQRQRELAERYRYAVSKGWVEPK